MLPKSVIILIFTLFIVLPTTYFVVKHLKSQQSQSQSGPTQPPITCGNTTCSSGEDCIQLSNLNPDTYTNLINTKGSEITSHDDTTKSLTFCHKPTSNLTVQNALPSSIQTNQSNYPYYNFEIPVGDKVGLCIPNSVSSTDTTCFSKGKTDCSGSCQWAVLPDNYDKTGGLVDTQVKNYMNFKNNYSQGYYCDPGTLSLGKVTQTNSTNWKDCISQLSNQGIIDANWDDTNKICNLFQIPPYKNNSNQPIQKIKCNASGSPCANCKSDTDFVNAVRCTGAGVPCTNCYKAGDYICDTCQPPTNTNGWNFTTCAPNDSNGNIVQVVSYGSGSGSGNCPWGCSSVNGGGNCYNFDTSTGSGNVFGQPLGQAPLDIVCMQDSQIRSEPKYYYKFDSAQGKCVQTTDQSYPSSICDCIKNANAPSLTQMQIAGVGVVAYIMDNNNKKNYIYYDGGTVYKFTTNINDQALVGGNITFNTDGSINIQGTGPVSVRGSPAGLGSNWFSGNLEFQYAAYTPYVGGEPYDFMSIYVYINEIKTTQVLKFNYGYKWTTYGQIYVPYGSGYVWITDNGDPPGGGTIVDSRWKNQGITTGNNNIYFSTIKLEKEILSNNC